MNKQIVFSMDWKQRNDSQLPWITYGCFDVSFYLRIPTQNNHKTLTSILILNIKLVNLNGILRKLSFSKKNLPRNTPKWQENSKQLSYELYMDTVITEKKLLAQRYFLPKDKIWSKLSGFFTYLSNNVMCRSHFHPLESKIIRIFL